MTANDTSSELRANEFLVNVETLESCFNERISKEVGNLVDAVEDRIQNAFSTAIGSLITTKIELAVRSKNASSGQDATSVTANSECGERVGLLPLSKTHPKGMTHDMC